jgi:hypothetical protein
MLHFAIPMLSGFVALGAVAGALAGRRLWGRYGAVLLGTALAVAPLFVAYLAAAWGVYHYGTKGPAEPERLREARTAREIRVLEGP